MCRKRQCKVQTSGFTLLEILIALFIFTIIAVIMTYALHNTLSAQAQTEKNSKEFAELQHALLLIARDAEQIINRPVINYQNKVETPVLGGPTQINFTHAGFENPQGILQRSTLQRVSYHLDKKQNLIRDNWDALDQSPTSKSKSRIILHHVTSIHFDYLNAKKLFNEHWPEPNSSQQSPLPHAIRLTMVLEHHGKLEQTYIIPDQSDPPQPPQDKSKQARSTSEPN